MSSARPDYAKLANLWHWRIEQKLATRLFSYFVGAINKKFQVAAHHALLFQVAQRIAFGGNLFIAISLPPRHSKSEIFSVLLPAFYLGLYPERQILHVSYSSTLSNDFSRRVREIIRDDPNYKALFPSIGLHPDKARIDDWKTLSGGGFKSVGVGGGITGTGFDLAILDDLVKEGDERSPKILEQHFDWYSSALITRMMPNASILIPMTRWHPLDIVGRVLALSKADANAAQYENLVLPALAKENDILGRQAGEALWPARFPRPFLISVKAVSSRYFDALYQQEPRSSDNQMFIDSDFRREVLPARVKGFWTFDLAASEENRSDYHALGRWQKHDDGTLHLTHVRRYRKGWNWIKRFIETLLKLFPEDDFVFPTQTYEALMFKILRAQAGSDRLLAVSLGQEDKVERAQVLEDEVKEGRLFVVLGKDGTQFIEEHCAFPEGAHDDFVDMSSVAAYHLGYNRKISAIIAKD